MDVSSFVDDEKFAIGSVLCGIKAVNDRWPLEEIIGNRFQWEIATGDEGKYN